MEPSTSLEHCVNRFIDILKANKSSLDAIELVPVHNLAGRAVQCIVAATNVNNFQIDSRYQQLILAMIKYPEVIEQLREWRGQLKENILHVAFKLIRWNPFLLTALVKKIGLDPLFEKNQFGQSPMTHRDYSIVEELLVIKDSDEFQILARFLLLRKARQAVQRVELLLPHFKAEDGDKIKAAEILKSMTEYGRRQDRFLGDIWFQAAKKFPQSDDSKMATMLLIALLPQAWRYTKPGLISELIKHYPEIDVELILISVKEWPAANSELVAKYMRSAEAPSWLWRGILRTTLEDCGHSCNCERNTVKSSTADKTDQVFYLFEDLPEDLIYVFLPHLRYKDVIALSLTNKRNWTLVNKSQHVWSQAAQKYFTNVPVRNAVEFRRAHKSKFKTGKLIHHFHRFFQLQSLELNEDKAIVMLRSGKLILLETNCLDRPRRPKKLKTIQLSESLDQAARLFNDNIYVLNRSNLTKFITILDAKNMRYKHQFDCPFIENQYFTVDETNLTAKGFSVDLTTQKVQVDDWSTDLSKWIIRNGMIYGSEIIRYDGEKRESTARLKLFDVRTPEKLAASLYITNLRCFNVSEHNIYAVSSRIMQWDKRFLLKPVRTSTDPFYYNKNKYIGYPTIDLTSMTVIGADQIWDLTDFTWQLPKLNIELSCVTSNGLLVAYYSSTSMNIRQNPCTYLSSAPIVTHADLNCKISTGHLGK